MDIELAQSIGWLGIAILGAGIGLGAAYALFRLGRMLRRVDNLVHDVTDEAVPVIGKVGESVDTVNAQLDKVDLMMNSAVDVADSLDRSVRAVSTAVTEPVKKVSAAMSGASEAISSFGEQLHDDGAHDSDGEPTHA